MKRAVDMGSDTMIYKPNFINIVSVFQKLINEDTQTKIQEGDYISLLYERRLKVK
jgi:hypothetical protein